MKSLRRGPALGVSGAPLQVNFARIGDGIRSVIDAVAMNVSAERLTALGVRVVAANARFADRRTVIAGETTIRARRFVIATGARSVVPAIPGLDGADCLTAEAAFNLVGRPAHLIILGAGGHALEIAQAYNRLGIETTVVDEATALAGSDPELVAIVLERLRAEGLRIRDGLKIVGAARHLAGIRLSVVEGGEERTIDGSHLLAFSRWAPNIEDLGLESAGIAHDENGIVVDRRLRTANSRIFAIGDVIAGPRLVSRAEYEARCVLRSIVYRRSSRPDPLMTAAVTFTDPAFAAVGLDEAAARARHRDVRVLRYPFAANDLAQAERTPAGMIKAIVGSNGRILGAAVVGRDAGEVVVPWSLAISARLGIVQMAAFVPPYPTRSEIARRVAAGFDASGEPPAWKRRLIAFLRLFG